MDDKQQNRLNMFIKTADFLGNHSVALAPVTQIATLKTALDTKIAAIIDADGEAGSDTSGFTIQKSLGRDHLEYIVLKVSRAVAAYGLSLGDPGMLKLADYTKSEIESKRDTDLYVKAKQLYKIAHPVEALLAGFNSGPADVTELKTRMDAFFDVLQLPEEKRGEKKASGLEVDMLFTEAEEKLFMLDIYMQTFEAVDSTLYNTYLSARAIDESGGGSQNSKSGTVAMTAVANIPFADGKIEADTVLKLMNNDTVGDLIFYFSDSTSGGTGTATETITVAANSDLDIVAGVKGFTATNHFLNVFNPMAFQSKWRVQIL